MFKSKEGSNQMRVVRLRPTVYLVKLAYVSD
jgi:hypothetical protein